MNLFAKITLIFALLSVQVGANCECATAVALARSRPTLLAPHHEVSRPRPPICHRRTTALLESDKPWSRGQVLQGLRQPRSSHAPAHHFHTVRGPRSRIAFGPHSASHLRRRQATRPLIVVATPRRRQRRPSSPFLPCPCLCTPSACLAASIPHHACSLRVQQRSRRRRSDRGNGNLSCVCSHFKHHRS